jgi:hypothetical protein
MAARKRLPVHFPDILFLLANSHKEVVPPPISEQSTRPQGETTGAAQLPGATTEMDIDDYGTAIMKAARDLLADSPELSKLCGAAAREHGILVTVEVDVNVIFATMDEPSTDEAVDTQKLTDRDKSFLKALRISDE